MNLKFVASLILFGILAVGETQAEPNNGSTFALKNLHFGQSFISAQIAAAPSQFYRPFIRECAEEIPIKGCIIFAQAEGAAFLNANGIPLHLNLTFNRYDQLVEIGIGYKTTKANSAECADMAHRAVDWVASEYMQLSVQPDIEGDGGATHLVTVAGNPIGFYFHHERQRPEWVSARMGAASGHVGIFFVGSFIEVSGVGHCRLSINFSDRNRPPYLRD